MESGHGAIFRLSNLVLSEPVRSDERMARGGEELHDLDEARRHVVDHDDEDTAMSSRAEEAPSGEDTSSRRSEGLDTLKCYLREIRH
jgi:hypothetical protein